MNNKFYIILFVMVVGCIKSNKEEQKQLQTIVEKDTLILKESKQENEVLDEIVEDKQEEEGSLPKTSQIIEYKISDELNISKLGIGNIQIGDDIMSIIENDLYVLRDSIVESDEGVTWKAKTILRKDSKEELVLLETNWVDKHKISRITILSSLVTIDGKVKIGNRFKDVKMDMSDIVPRGGPDGYLFLNHKDSTSINIEFNISNYKEIYYGISNLEEVPDDVKVSSIIIM